ncbi:6251_t:CDS:2 [Funneliformis geosporum]|uniref:6251_t:CDS:1 n=1 Tax=Funneliformis geosporum TaxID=1117311 RepID=A0A9W4SEL4_9GLOM|nr:6251_t:CDS:2 [Funneliformis geosporum]
MRLEYKVLEIAKDDEQELGYNTPDGYADIVFICGECKKDYDNNTLP